ncbi:hypothetical protein [Lyngbya confervoides]|uniref:OB domain-containing protein n=1 Tax=Lyngbya confervoides BDU141951 TaxID=1574623 RepID=A0ABD4T1I0_9CYAN|nr:hypothetical protein [Lyngbya confervoides]MCM1982256.1 hypothetical protein [Lyngbya confervoides BDU141951]
MWLSAGKIKALLEAESRSPQSRPAVGFVIPRINQWVIDESQGNRIRIRGWVEHHCKYPKGTKITTSQIIGFQIIGDRKLVATRRSIYELGEAVIQLPGQEHLPHQTLSEKVGKLSMDPWDLDLAEEETQEDLTGIKLPSDPDARQN